MEAENLDPTCVQNWPECEDGKYDPRCCRFPKSCSPFLSPPAQVKNNSSEEDMGTVLEAPSVVGTTWYEVEGFTMAQNHGMDFPLAEQSDCSVAEGGAMYHFQKPGGRSFGETGGRSFGATAPSTVEAKKYLENYATKPPARWAFWKWLDIPNLDTGEIYLRRLRVFQTPWFGILVHWIFEADPDTYLHNHPWGFCSLIWSGGYHERYANTKDWAIAEARNGPIFGLKTVRTNFWKRFSLHKITRKNFHRIVSLEKVPTVTVLFVGPRLGHWGFATKNGFVDHEDYHKELIGE